MKIFTTSQIRELDSQTIEREPISSIALMERAADRMLQQFKKDFSFGKEVLILAGPGNNGGDGLALGRMLIQIGYDVQVLLLHKGKLSPDCKTNKERLVEFFPDFFAEQTQKFLPPEISSQAVVVDALFGSGITRPLEGIFRDAAEWLNSIDNRVLSVDIPSGLDGETCVSKDDVIVRADSTYTLQFPKLAFLFPENERFVGNWKVIDIQLHPKAIAETSTNYNYLGKKEIQDVLKSRSRFSHKGTFGHALIWAGKKGMAGAAVLVSQSALRAGAGLVSVHSGEENRVILQTAVPEAIFVNELNTLDNYNAFAFGPGLGTEKETAEMLFELLKNLNRPCVLDADALNIIFNHQEFLDFIPANTILTPHPKEFDRLFGHSKNSRERIEKASAKAQELQVIIVLKGANTLVALPDGTYYFNSTGNPGMAVGGMGDVLTGIIAGLLTQNYTPEESALLGVFLHGLAGDLALSEQSQESLLPRDVIKKLGAAFNLLRER
ncbi:MAG: NAD(P)H-hydrate dehydratase [Bacteroidales bacterium]|nr:NAD(P)H-hydrate dehydratase [Bacteroidales bacterium]